ncbi:unnamed protein product [Colias eurytheme]|nr:unnamed protein product [Colias eurytheme]
MLLQFVDGARFYDRDKCWCRGGTRAVQETSRDRLAAGRRHRRACRRLPHARPAATREPPPARTMEND